jgi:hypothetical protein
MKNLPDQTEVLAENAQLDLQARNLRAQLAVKGKRVAAPETSKDLFDNNATLKAHVAELQAALAGKASIGAKENLTALVLKAKGVASLAELAQKHKEPIND